MFSILTVMVTLDKRMWREKVEMWRMNDVGSHTRDDDDDPATGGFSGPSIITYLVYTHKEVSR